MSRLKDRLLNYHIQVKKFADDDQMILANDVLSMIEQLQDDLEWYEKPKLTKTEKSFIEALDPSWSYMLRNGKGQLYLARKVDSMYGSNFKYLYLEGITFVTGFVSRILRQERSMCEVWHGYREKSTIRSTDKRGN